MEQETDNTATTETEGQAPEGTESEQQTSEVESEQEQQVEEPSEEEGDKKKLTPEQLEAELERTRREAAARRTRVRELEQSLEGAKSPEEFEAAVNEYKAQIAALELSVARSDVARKYGLPDDLASALQGSDAAALEAHAKVLAKYVPSTNAEDLQGGLAPNSGSDADEDPAKLARDARRRRY